MLEIICEHSLGPGGDRDCPVSLWRNKLECGAGQPFSAWQKVPFLQLQRKVWENCKTGRVSLDVHPGDHFIPHDRIARQLDEMLGLPNSYP